MEFKDYYKTLGVERSATADDIKSAYRKLARKYHPDVSKEPQAEARFKEIGEAYEVLQDTEKRAAYDQLGNRWREGQEFTPPPDWGPGSSSPRARLPRQRPPTSATFFQASSAVFPDKPRRGGSAARIIMRRSSSRSKTPFRGRPAPSRCARRNWMRRATWRCANTCSTSGFPKAFATAS